MEDVSIMLLSGLLPAILLVLYVRYRDKQQPEPWSKIIKGVFYGLLSILVTVLITQIWNPLPFVLGLGWLYEVPIVRGIFTSFYNAAIPEETAKLFMLWLLLRNNKEFNQNIDGIVYAVCVSMGFAGLENVMYIFNDGEEPWQAIAIVRSLFAVPGHYIFGVLMGFFYSIVYFRPKKYGKYKNMIWIAPVLAHGLYDSICFLGEEHYLFGALIYIPLIWFCVKMHKFSFKRINKMLLFDEDRNDLSMFTMAMQKENSDN
jgi:RsiW-degrading membrane proteinase PrsW (M82 family)